VLEDDPNLIAILLLDLLEGRTDPLTEGSLEVGELDDRDRRLLRAERGCPVMLTA
jgi:hypothetical protein